MSFINSDNIIITVKPDKCMDCNNSKLLCEVCACTDYHLYGIKCCTKYICSDYCEYICTNCTTTNKLDKLKINRYDNYYDGYKCYNCYHINNVKCTFWGDLKQICDQYCGMNCIPENIILEGVSQSTN